MSQRARVTRRLSRSKIASQSAPPSSFHWCTDWCAEPSLFLGKGGHELAAEVGDVWDHAAPYQVKRVLRRLQPVAEGFSDSLESLRIPGWCAHGCEWYD